MGSCRCKMCGGQIHYDDGVSTATCEFCGTEQTIVKTDDLKQLNLFNRANSLRLQNEFDKAQTTYENILIDDPSNAEAHWGICLCRYGIEYVDDAKTNKKVPTCHRTVFDFIWDDLDYKEAINNADVVAKKLYEKEAQTIDKIQKNILAISQKEAPYDIFICYKETDNDGNRTKDSVIAQDIYDELIKHGYKVFFSKISLESKIGSEYEPIIFAALMSSKVMLAIGSKVEYYNSPWVKNEWGRFLSFMKEQQGKYLIPCYIDMEAYDMPEEFLMLQAQDVSKIGYMQDLIRGINKLFGKAKNVVNEPIVAPVINNYANKNISNLIERVKLCIEDQDYEKADNIIEDILNVDAKCSEVYFYRTLAAHKVQDADALIDKIDFSVDDKNFTKALRFANEDYKEFLLDIKEKICKKRYGIAMEYKNKKNYDDAITLFKTIEEYEDSQLQIEECKQIIKEMYDEQKKSLDNTCKILDDIIKKVEQRHTFVDSELETYKQNMSYLFSYNLYFELAKSKHDYYNKKLVELQKNEKTYRAKKQNMIEKIVAISIIVTAILLMIIIYAANS